MHAYKHTTDMQPTQGPMVSDEALTDLWNQCRLIGIINKICLYFITVLLVMHLLPLLIGIGCPYCKHDKWQQICEMYHSVEKQTTMIFAGWRIFIFICLSLAFLIKMIFVNNGLRSTDIVIPADRNKVKSWLRWHVDFLVVSVVTFIGFLFKGCVCSSNDYVYYYIPLKLGVTIIVLTLEINIVRKFNKKFKISANRRNRKVVPLNI